MRGDEIHRGAALGGVLEKLRHPRRARSRRTADTKLRIDLFDCLRGDVVQLEIGLLVSALEEAGEVRLVPDLEIPAANLVGAITLAQVCHERADQVRPAIEARMRRI